MLLSHRRIYGAVDGGAAHKKFVIWLTAWISRAMFGLAGKSNADLHRKLLGSIVICPLPKRDTHSADVTKPNRLRTVQFVPNGSK